VRMLQKTELHLHHRWVVYFCKRFVWLVFGRSRAFHGLMWSLYRTVSPQKEYLDFVRDAKPDMVFITDAFGDADMALWRAASRLFIPCAVMVRSWDNLTNHGILRLMPDRLIVHSPFIKDLAMRLHHIPENIISMTGIPQYDWYTDTGLFMNREDFCREIGADPGKKLILFAGIGDFLAPHEWEVVKILSEEMEAGRMAYPATILFRPHPNFLTQREKIRALPGVIFDDRVARYTGQEKSTMEMGRAEMAHLINSLRHADVVVTGASSIAIDASAFDRPIVCIAFDGYADDPYWNSVRRYYRDFTHYQLIAQTHGFRIAYDKNGMVSFVNEYLRNPSLDSEGRKKIVNEFIWKLDGASARRLGNAVVGTKSFNKKGLSLSGKSQMAQFGEK